VLAPGPAVCLGCAKQLRREALRSCPMCRHAIDWDRTPPEQLPRLRLAPPTPQGAPAPRPAPRPNPPPAEGEALAAELFDEGLDLGAIALVLAPPLDPPPAGQGRGAGAPAPAGDRDELERAVAASLEDARYQEDLHVATALSLSGPPRGAAAPPSALDRAAAVLSLIVPHALEVALALQPPRAGGAAAGTRPAGQGRGAPAPAGDRDELERAVAASLGDARYQEDLHVATALSLSAGGRGPGAGGLPLSPAPPRRAGPAAAPAPLPRRGRDGALGRFAARVRRCFSGRADA